MAGSGPRASGDRPTTPAMPHTGGFYARTHLFPDLAMRRLEGALSGHYVLTFEKPPLRPGSHRIEIDLVGRKGTVFAKSFYEG